MHLAMYYVYKSFYIRTYMKIIRWHYEVSYFFIYSVDEETHISKYTLLHLAIIKDKTEYVEVLRNKFNACKCFSRPNDILLMVIYSNRTKSPNIICSILKIQGD